jgi:hypothetical protein
MLLTCQLETHAIFMSNSKYILIVHQKMRWLLKLPLTSYSILRGKFVIIFCRNKSNYDHNYLYKKLILPK